MQLKRFIHDILHAALFCDDDVECQKIIADFTEIWVVWEIGTIHNV